MMPEPGFQKPMPKLDPADDRKSYTSLFVRTACSRSATPPNWPCLEWQSAVNSAFNATQGVYHTACPDFATPPCCPLLAKQSAMSFFQ